MDLVIFKNIYGREVKTLMMWFDDIADRLDINIDYTNIIKDDMVCDFSFEAKKFNIGIHDDYIELTLKKHPSEYYSIYDMDFTEFVIK